MFLLDQPTPVPPQPAPAQQGMDQQQAEQAAIEKFSKETAIKFKDQNGGTAPLVIRAKNCVELDYLNNNIADNIRLIPKDKWIRPCKRSHTKAVIASAGPSLKDHYEELKERQKRGDKIFAVKHSLPKLMGNGIIPDGVIILDPRAVTGTSTHGVVRSTLFDSINTKKTTFFVASMTDPSVTRMLMEKGARVIGWHASVGEIHQKFLHFAPWGVNGGSCSAVRGINLLQLMGFTHITLAGFDACMDSMPKDFGAVLQDGRPKYVQVTVGDKEFVSTGELVAMVQDLERLFMDKMSQLTLDILPGGMLKPIYDLHYRSDITDYDTMIKEMD